MKPKIYYDFFMDPKCRFCNGKQEDAGFKTSDIPYIRENRFKCNTCLTEQSYDRIGSLLEFTLLVPIDRTTKFDYDMFHYVIDFDPRTMKLMVRSYGGDCGWSHHFEAIVRNEPSWLNPSLSIEKIKTLILFS